MHCAARLRLPLPHAWVGDSSRKLSTHDLALYGRFTLITGLYFDWAKLRGVAEDGALLVRQDKHVG